jgi:hypothetical protein
MKTVLNRLKGVLHVTVRAERQYNKDELVRVTGKKSTILDTTGQVHLITSLLVLSLVQQIVGASLLQRLGDRQDINKDIK